MTYSLMTTSTQPELRSSAPVRKMAVISGYMARQEKNPESLHSTVLDSADHSQMVAVIIIVAITYLVISIINHYFKPTTLL